MSGKPCHQRALDAVKYTRDTYGDRFAVEGIGGVFTVEDALEMLDAGADLVGFVSTLMFNGPQQASLFASGLLNVISYSELSEAGKIRSLR
jgi:dihydroorotate dehydrogenase (fumarate)